MDFVNNLTGGNSKDSNDKKDENKSGGGGGIMDSVNNFAGGGEKGEKNEDGLDKGNPSSPIGRSEERRTEANIYKLSTSFRRSLWVKGTSRTSLPPNKPRTRL